MYEPHDICDVYIIHCYFLIQFIAFSYTLHSSDSDTVILLAIGNQSNTVSITTSTAMASNLTSNEVQEENIEDDNEFITEEVEDDSEAQVAEADLEPLSRRRELFLTL